MNGDFLDSVISRVGEPAAFAVQPRLASRFETPSALTIDTGVTPESDEDAEAVTYARPRDTSKTSSHPETSVVRSAPATPEHSVAKVPVIPTHDSANSAVTSVVAPNDDFESRLDQLARRLDTLPQSSPQPAVPNVTIPNVQDAAAADTPPPAVAPSVTVNEVSQHNHEHTPQSQPRHSGSYPAKFFRCGENTADHLS